MVLGITRLTPLGRFRRAYRRLDRPLQEEVDRALRELPNSAALPAGRNLKKVRSPKNTWEIRVNKGVRLTFEVDNGTCVLRNVGEHDKVLDDP